MDVKQLKANMRKAMKDGYQRYVVYFCDQDGDYVSIDTYYLDDDGDLCLESNEYDNVDYTAQQLYDIISQYDDDTYVYIYDEDCDTSFDIEDEDDENDWNDLWYIGDDGNLYMDTYYDDDDDDDDDDNYNEYD